MYSLSNNSKIGLLCIHGGLNKNVILNDFYALNLYNMTWIQVNIIGD